MTTRQAIVVVLAAGWVALTALAIQDAERRGARKARIDQLAARIETLTVQVEKLDTIFRDSVRYATKWRTRWDTVKATDTITVDSVVYVPLAPAESTITACFAALRSCERAGMAKDTLIRAQQAQISVLTREAQRSQVREWMTRGGFLLAGVGVGALVK